jgi:hypothetical protein
MNITTNGSERMGRDRESARERESGTEWLTVPQLMLHDWPEAQVPGEPFAGVAVVQPTPAK